jgi:hypothetical protein
MEEAATEGPEPHSKINSSLDKRPGQTLLQAGKVRLGRLSLFPRGETS